MAGDYELFNRRPFRSGGLADLELCELRSGRTAVLRKLQDQFKFNLAIRSRFVKGLEVREQIGRHDHVAWTYETGREGLTPFELIEYVDGPNLQELMDENITYVRLRSLEILLQVAQAIQHCHEKGFVHLDIKPANVLVEIGIEQPAVRLTDFDLALPADTGKGGKKIRMGTYNYMPPEMLVDGEVTPHADIFAFGVMAYFVSTGRMPFPGHNAQESREAKINPGYKVPAMRGLAEGASPQFCEIVHRCLDPRRDYRGTMKAIVRELCQTMANRAIAAMRRGDSAF